MVFSKTGMIHSCLKMHMAQSEKNKILVFKQNEQVESVEVPHACW